MSEAEAAFRKLRELGFNRTSIVQGWRAMELMDEHPGKADFKTFFNNVKIVDLKAELPAPKRPI